MRILFLTHNFPPETNAPALRTFENCRRWVRMGHEVTVITGPPNFPAGVLHAGYRNRWLAREEMDGIQVIRTWMYLAANRGFGRRILNYLSFMVTAVWASFFAPPCDLVIGTSPQFFVGIAALVASALRRRPFVFEVRDLWPESIVAVGAMKPGRAVALLDRIARFLYRRADRIIVVTEAFRRVLEGYGIDPSKIAVVTNGVDLEQFQPAEKQNGVRRELGLNGQFVASYVGTLGMAHGLSTVLDAAQQLRDRNDIRFLIMGDGADKEHLDAELRRRDLPNVLLVERRPHAQMPEFLAASDASLVLLRKNDLFKTVLPSKIFEAMGAARPIILGVEGEAAALIRAGDCGVVVEAENAEELAAAVLGLKEAPQLSARLGRNGRDFARRYYDRDVLASRYAQILEDLAAPASRRAGIEPAVEVSRGRTGSFEIPVSGRVAPDPGRSGRPGSELVGAAKPRR